MRPADAYRHLVLLRCRHFGATPNPMRRSPDCQRCCKCRWVQRSMPPISAGVRESRSPPRQRVLVARRPCPASIRVCPRARRLNALIFRHSPPGPMPPFPLAHSQECVAPGRTYGMGGRHGDRFIKSNERLDDKHAKPRSRLSRQARASRSRNVMAARHHGAPGPRRASKTRAGRRIRVEKWRKIPAASLSAPRCDYRSFLDRDGLFCHNGKPPLLVGVPILLRSDLCGLKSAIGWFRTLSIRRDT